MVIGATTLIGTGVGVGVGMLAGIGVGMASAAKNKKEEVDDMKRHLTELRNSVHEMDEHMISGYNTMNQSLLEYSRKLDAMRTEIIRLA